MRNTVCGVRRSGGSDLPVRAALVTIAAVWASTKPIGFALLGYPRALDTAMWGFAIGAAAQTATFVAATVLRRLSRDPVIVAYAIALAASFAGYELCLWAVTPILGGTEAFAPKIVAWLALLNAVWLAGLVGAYEAIRGKKQKVRRYALREAAP
jgi:hypothetical protein